MGLIDHSQNIVSYQGYSYHLSQCNFCHHFVVVLKSLLALQKMYYVQELDVGDLIKPIGIYEYQNAGYSYII